MKRKLIGNVSISGSGPGPGKGGKAAGAENKLACKTSPTLNNPQIQFPRTLDRVRGSLKFFARFENVVGDAWGHRLEGESRGQRPPELI